MEGTVNLDTPKQDKPRKGRRSKFPDHLPRVTTKVELQASDRICGHCEGELHEIGQEVTRELECLETTIEHKIARAKYACRTCTEGIKTAPAPPRVIDKGLLGPGFLAHVAVERFAHHMPYNRLEKKYASEGLELSRSVLERSMSRIAEIFTPVYDQLLREVVASPVLFTDDTTVTIARTPGKAGSSTGRVWTYNDRDGRHVFDFTETRKRDGPLAILGGYTGCIHADAYAGYVPSSCRREQRKSHAGLTPGANLSKQRKPNQS